MASNAFNTFANRSLLDDGIKSIKPLIIGIIGAENSHTAAFGKLFNIDKLFPGGKRQVRVGRDREFC